MKTSNKLILILALALFLSTASVMLYAKTQLTTTKEYIEELKLTGSIVERVLTSNLTKDNIEMGDNFTWIIDPNSSEVVVSGDEALVSKLTVSDSKQYSIRTGGVDFNLVDEDMVSITVGIKNLNNLTINGGGNAGISALSAINLEEVELRMGGNARCKLDISSPTMVASTSGNGVISIQGETETIDAYLSGNGKLYAEKFSVKNVLISVSGNSEFHGGEVKSISGNGSGNGKIYLRNVSENSNVSTSGNSRVTINR